MRSIWILLNYRQALNTSLPTMFGNPHCYPTSSTLTPKIFTSTVMLLFFIPSSATFAANFFARPPGSSPTGDKATLKRGDRRDRKPWIKHAVSVRSSRAHADTAEARPGIARYMLSNAPLCSRYSHIADS